MDDMDIGLNISRLFRIEEQRVMQIKLLVSVLILKILFLCNVIL